MARVSRMRRVWTARWPRAFFQYDRNVYLLLLFTLGKGFQLSIGALSINLYVFSLGYQSDFIGLIAAMPAIGSLAAAVPVGLIADRIGRKPLLVMSGLLNPFALAAIALSTSPALLIVASLLNGVFSSAYWVTNLPLLTENSTEEQRVGVLALNSFLLLGVGSLGALLGGAVPEIVAAQLHVSATSMVPLRWGVLAAAIIVFIPALPLIFLRERSRKDVLAEAHTPVAPTGDIAETPAATAVPVIQALEPVGRMALTLLFIKLLLPDALFTTGEGATVGLLQIFFRLRYNLQPGTLGLLYTVAGICGGATALSAPRLVRRWGKLRTATRMQYLSAPTVLLIGFAPFFQLAALGEFARNIFRGFFEPTYAAFAMERVSTRHRATLSGFYSVTWSVGYTIGPTITGWLQVHVGLSAGFVLSAVCIAMAASLLRVFFWRDPLAMAT